MRHCIEIEPNWFFAVSNKRGCAMKTLKISLIGTAIGLGAWLFGIGHILWPAHPQIAGFLITLGTTIVAQISWPLLNGLNSH
jgi:hypothetical protein